MATNNTESKTPRVKLEFKLPESKTLDYKGVQFEVLPFLTLAEQVFLINKYVEQYFSKATNGILISGTNYNYMNAEYSLFNYILQANTNIDTDSLPEDFYADAEIREKITSSIVNFYDFKSKLNYLINEIKQQMALENSVGKVLSDLVDKIYAFLAQMSDVKPEDIEKLQKEGSKALGELAKSSIIQDASKAKK